MLQRALEAMTRWRRERQRGPPAPAAPHFEAEFAAIFARAAIGITITDGLGTFLRTNPAFERFLGFAPGELIGASVRSITHPEDWGVDVTLFMEIRRGERSSYQVEKRNVRKDGAIVWGRLIASGVRRGEDGSLYGLGMVEDINQQRLIQEQLNASRAQLEQVNARLKLYLERAPLACIVWGLDRIVREWNPAAETMFGYSAAEAIGRNVYELTATPGGLVVIDGVRAQVLAGGAYPEGVIVENRRKDDSRLQCHWRFAIVGRNTPEEAVIAFGADVTASLRADAQRESLEANLRQAQKMQSLGTLAGGIAHDFNNILLAIAGNTKLAAQDLAADHPAQTSLAEVSKASARAASIVNQILAFGRREESAHRPIDLRTIVEESLNLMRATLPSRVTIRMRSAPKAQVVRGDPAQMHQVMVNLATNAAHAMSDAAGALDVELDEVDLDSSQAHAMHVPPTRYRRICVSDDGAGMPPEVIERVFEPFFTTKPRGQGAGLGLSVVHGIVKAHGGAIEVRSEPGKGSTFRVYLPAVEESLLGPLATPGAALRGQGQRILYVDDEEPLVYLMTRVLERLDYRVVGFVSASEALDAFRSTPGAFDVVVTDLSMPGMSGAEFAKHVLELRPDVPVVMTSGYVRAEDRETALQTGVREMILKPNTVEELGDVLHRLLSEARPLPRLSLQGEVGRSPGEGAR